MRPGCEYELREHIGRKCPRMKGNFLVRRALSQSFSERELRVLHFIVAGLTQGKDISAVRRSPDFQKVAQKIVRMRQKIGGIMVEEGIEG